VEIFEWNLPVNHHSALELLVLSSAALVTAARAVQSFGLVILNKRSLRSEGSPGRQRWGEALPKETAALGNTPSSKRAQNSG
jgi:hypothetical protein